MSKLRPPLLNKIMMTGYCVGESKLFDSDGHKPKLVFTILCLSKSGRKTTNTNIPIAVLGEKALSCEKWIKRGTYVYVEGQLRYNSRSISRGVENPVYEIHTTEIQNLGIEWEDFDGLPF